MYLLVGFFFFLSLVTKSRHAPGRNRVTSRRGGTFATAVRVVDRVHGRAANGGPDAHPALAAGFAGGQVLVLGIAYLADGRPAFQMDHAHLTRRQTQDRVVAFFGHDLGGSPGRPGDLSALPLVQLDVVHDGTHRDVPDGNRATHFVMSEAGPASIRITHLQLVRRQDVALVAIRIQDQRDAAAAVRIVLDGATRPGTPSLSRLKSMILYETLVSPALMAGGDAAVVVAAALALHRSGQ